MWREIRVSARQGAGQAAVNEGEADRNQREASFPQFLLSNSAPRDRRKAGHRLEVIEVHGIADVLARGLSERLEIPGLDFALVERGVDEPAPALAFANPRIQFDEIPALSSLGAKIGDDLGSTTVCLQDCRARAGRG